jgi:hypothetical protein
MYYAGCRPAFGVVAIVVLAPALARHSTIIRRGRLGSSRIRRLAARHAVVQRIFAARRQASRHLVHDRKDLPGADVREPVPNRPESWIHETRQRDTRREHGDAQSEEERQDGASGPAADAVAATPGAGAPTPGRPSPGGPSRWSMKRSAEWQPVKPKHVVEVSCDHFTGGRFRHGTSILRWRPEKNQPSARSTRWNRRSTAPFYPSSS